MEKSNCKGINIDEILQSKQFVFVSSKEALKDVEPIQWSEDVLSGKVKVTVYDNQ